MNEVNDTSSSALDASSHAADWFGVISIFLLIAFAMINSFVYDMKIDRFLVGSYHLFFSRKFELHRLGGLLFILQYVAACIYYIYDCDSFIDSFLVFSLPLFGLLQSVSASFYFTFLPRKIDAAFMGDKFGVSYAFIVENVFFAMILCFQWWYFSDFINSYIPNMIRIAFIFFPYVWRPLFPKTSFRDSLYNDINKTAKDFNFFVNSTYFVKTFYVFSKHFIGYFLNYIRFMDRVNRGEQIDIYLMLLVASFSTTIAMFLHTLSFRGYITKRRSMELYLASLVVLTYSWTAMYWMIINNLDLAFLVFIGLLLNFKNKYYQHTFQVIVFGILYSNKYYGVDYPFITSYNNSSFL